MALSRIVWFVEQAMIGKHLGIMNIFDVKILNLAFLSSAKQMRSVLDVFMLSGRTRTNLPTRKKIQADAVRAHQTNMNRRRKRLKSGDIEHP